MLKALDAPNGSVIIADWEIAIQANLNWLRSRGHKYLVSSCDTTREFDDEEEQVTSIKTSF